jgi:hypothetical protein
VKEIEVAIVRWHKDNEASRRLAAIPGVGPITASAIEKRRLFTAHVVCGHSHQISRLGLGGAGAELEWCANCLIF